MNAQTVRDTFLRFFTERGHTLVPSSSVLPHGDPTILFTNAGMNQFKETFIGRETRPYTRAVSSQKCVRAGGKHNDLDNVGYTARHLTFFEMLGNFSFGDYFKREAIAWAWELLTGPYGLPADRLHATIFTDDDEAWTLWRKTVGLPEKRIVRLGEKDNFWSMGEVGPCGPCSELLFDRGPRHACGPACGIGRCDCDRFFEVWNLVFMQYDQAPDGTRTPLPRPSIDTGMGLERLCMVLQDVDSVYETDLLAAIIDRVVALSGRPYDRGRNGVPHRVIADHIRSVCFALADGAFPANEGRGYVIRRILRRACRYGRILELRAPFLHTLVDTVCALMGDAYEELRIRRDTLAEVVLAEEERFGQTLDQGLALFAEVRERLAASGATCIPGKDVFLLHDTYGFPPDLVARMAQEEGLTTDMEAYEALMEAQRAQSKAAAKFTDDPAADFAQTDGAPATVFCGYDATTVWATVAAVAPLPDGRTAVVLDHTPFYAASGGQAGDTGLIAGRGARLRVEDTQRRGAHVLHLGRVEGGALSPGMPVNAEVDAETRARTQRHHTATHLLHAALREELGTHVEQRGSLVAPGRLRFDFTHFAPVSPEQLRRVESRIAAGIVANRPVETEVMPIAEARTMGAMALFGEKYGETVRVVRIPSTSIELCGGTHVARTGDIGLVKILSEGSVAAGVRRVEAVAGPDALAAWHDTEDILERLAQALKTPPALIERRIEAMKQELSALKQKKTQTRAAEIDRGEKVIGAVTCAWRVLADAGAEDLRAAWDRVKDSLARTVLVLFGRTDDSASLLVCLSSDLRTGSGIHCGRLAGAGGKAMGAGGGGRPDMGQAGGKQPALIPQALAAILETLASQTA